MTYFLTVMVRPGPVRKPQRTQKKNAGTTSPFRHLLHLGCNPKSVIAPFVLCHTSCHQCFSFASILGTHCGVYPLSDHFINIVGPDSFSALFYIEAILWMCVSVSLSLFADLMNTTEKRSFLIRNPPTCHI